MHYDKKGLGSFFATIGKSLLEVLLPRPLVVRRLEHMSPHDLSERAGKARSDVHDIVSLFDYRDPLIKTFVWQIKFRGNKNLTALAAEVLHEHLLAELSELELFEGFTKPIIVPVPISKARLRERGFNQVERIARALEKIDGGANFEVLSAVIKIKETKSQTETKSKEERQKNLDGAFAVKNPQTVAGRNIIVLDDVMTTGSTISEMKKVLLASGAKSVTGFTFAH